MTEGEYLWAFGQLTAEHPDCCAETYFALPARLREVWNELRDEVLEAHIEAHPGTRPPHWWEREAPEPRRRIGGTGDPLPEVLAYAERFDCGLPVDWYDVSWRETYRTLHADAGYELRNHAESRVAVPIDPNDPPVYESQAAYLDRHGLLADSERAELAVHGWPEGEVSGEAVDLAD